MTEPTTPEEDEAFNEIERLSKIAQDLVRRQTELSQARNNVIEEVAQRIEKLTGFGQDTISSFAIYIRGMKK